LLKIVWYVTMTRRERREHRRQDFGSKSRYINKLKALQICNSLAGSGRRWAGSQLAKDRSLKTEQATGLALRNCGFFEKIIIKVAGIRSTPPFPEGLART
jgi:hypothetical protein